MTRFALALALFAQASTSLAQQPPARDAASSDRHRPVTFHMRVLTGDGSKPVGRARVVLAVNGGTGDPIYSDQQGRFDVTVPQNSGYTVRVTKAGYVPQDLTRLTVSDGEIDVRLVPAAVVTGRMVDQHGEPIVGGNVSVRRITGGPGTGGSTHETSTDDLGEFRVSSLEQGEYSVGPCCGVSAGVVNAHGRVPEGQRVQLRAGQETTVHFTFANVVVAVAPAARVGDDSLAAARSEAAILDAWASSGPARATPPSGSFTGGIIRGQITGPDGQPVAGALVRLISSIAATGSSGGFSARGIVTDARGQYQFRGISAGRYELMVQKAGLAHAKDAPGTQGTLREKEQLNGVDVVLSRGGTVSGRVIDWTGRPVAGARVFAETGRLESSRPSDAEGRYELGGLAAGTIRLVATKSSPSPGRARPMELRQVRTMVLTEGQRLDGIDLVFPRGSAISGRIVDELGEPVEGLIVRALQTRVVDGRTRAVSAARLKTDDRGQYRLYGLMPGTYYIVATDRTTVASGSGLELETSMGTYYPGRPSIEGALTVQVDSASDASGADFIFAPPHGARVSGLALHSSGQPVNGSALLAGSARNGVPLPEPMGSPISPNGEFEFQHVPPGDYVVQIIGRRLWGVSEEFATQRVNVQSGDMVPLLITTSSPSTLLGRIRLEGPSTSLAASRFTLKALPTDPDLTPALAIERTLEPRSAIRDDSTFEIVSLTGPARITATAPEGWWLKSVMIDGINAADQPVAFASRELTRTDVEVVFSSGAVTINGRVLGNRNQPAVDASVVVFPTDASRIYSGSRYIGLARSGIGGRFSVPSLPPGEYWVAAVNEVLEDRPNLDVLIGLTSGARLVTLAESESATLELRLAP